MRNEIFKKYQEMTIRLQSSWRSQKYFKYVEVLDNWKGFIFIFNFLGGRISENEPQNKMICYFLGETTLLIP